MQPTKKAVRKEDISPDGVVIERSNASSASSIIIMSSNSSSESQYYQQPGLSFEDGLIIAVGVLGLLMILVVLRFLFTFCIDVAILGDADSLRRFLGGVWRCLCPWWRPRTNPEHEDPSPNDVELQQQIDAARTGMSAEAWEALINSILPSKVNLPMIFCAKRRIY